jgi:hypothetical protein
VIGVSDHRDRRGHFSLFLRGFGKVFPQNRAIKSHFLIKVGCSDHLPKQEVRYTPIKVPKTDQEKIPVFLDRRFGGSRSSNSSSELGDPYEKVAPINVIGDVEGRNPSADQGPRHGSRVPIKGDPQKEPDQVAKNRSPQVIGDSDHVDRRI